MKPIQQRRSFFQTSTSDNEFGGGYNEIRNGRFRSCGWIAVISAALLFCSCASLTPDRVAVLAAIAGQASQAGTEEWLEKHPDHRKAFELAVAAFATSVRKGEKNAVDYLNGLPTSVFAGPAGALYISGNYLLVWDGELKKSVVATGPLEQPVLRATLAGLKRGVAPKPPRLPVRAKNAQALIAAPGSSTGLGAGAATTPVVKESLTTQEPLKVTTPLQSLTNNANQPIRQHLLFTNWTNSIWFMNNDEGRPAEIRPGTNSGSVIDATAPVFRTNVTRSVVDVRPEVGSASVLTVRWRFGPQSIYHVQRRDDGSVEWLTWGCVTNAVGTGPATWSTAWPPAQQVGSWRVLRVR